MNDAAPQRTVGQFSLYRLSVLWLTTSKVERRFHGFSSLAGVCCGVYSSFAHSWTNGFARSELCDQPRQKGSHCDGRGVALGDFIAMSASLAGLGALVLASATLFTVLKWVGAVYLIYLGIKLFRSDSTASLDNLEKVTQTSASSVFGHATAVTALNPKSIVFFIAFVPQFIVVDSPLLPQFAILVVTFVGLASINALAYALLADKLRAKIAKPSVLTWFSRLGGSALIAMGVATAAFKRSQ